MRPQTEGAAAVGSGEKLAAMASRTSCKVIISTVQQPELLAAHPVLGPNPDSPQDHLLIALKIQRVNEVLAPGWEKVSPLHSIRCRISHVRVSANARAQAARGKGVRHGTERESRACLERSGSTQAQSN